MRRLAFLTPLAAALAIAGATYAQPAGAQPVGSAPNVTVTVGGDLLKQVDKLGERDVQLQVDELAKTISQELADNGGFSGAQVNLVLTDLKPNRPTMQQTIDRPGLSMFDSISIGGAAVEGELVTAQGEHLPIRYSRYSNDLRDVFGYDTWRDANRTYDRLATNIVEGRLVSR